MTVIQWQSLSPDSSYMVLDTSAYPTRAGTSSPDLFEAVRAELRGAQFMVCDHCKTITIEHRVMSHMDCPVCGKRAISSEFAS